MPLPTLHLWVAERAAQLAGLPVSGRYLLGNLAPDAIHMRPDTDRTDKNRTHLREPNWNSAWDNSRLLLRQAQGDPYLLGCALHVLVDYLWIVGPWKNFRNALTPEEDAHWRKLYYADCDAIDRWLYQQGNSQALWMAVLKAPTADYLDLVSAGEVDLWRKDRHEFLRHSRQMQPARHITLTQAQTFVQEAGQGLARELTDSGAVQAVLDAREVL